MSALGGGLNRSTLVQRFRRGFSAAEKTELWDRWQQGELLKAIGRAFGKPSSSIYCQEAPQGGIRPAPRGRSRLALTLSERKEISRDKDRWGASQTAYRKRLQGLVIHSRHGARDGYTFNTSALRSGD